MDTKTVGANTNVAPAATVATNPPKTDQSGQKVDKPLASTTDVNAQKPTKSTDAKPVENAAVDVSERTKEQFEKLQDNNRKLYEANKSLQEELNRKIKSEQTFAPLQTPQPTDLTQQTTQPKEPSIEDFIEKDEKGDAFINEEKLKKAITEANQRAIKAETSVQQYIKQQQNIEDQRQRAEVYQAYPELNPKSDNFDTELNKRTRSILIDSMMNPNDYGDRTLTYKEAADEAKKQSPAEAKATEEKVDAEETKRQEKQVQAEQGSLEAQGISASSSEATSSSPDEELNVLRDKTRHGDMWALARRLTRVPHAGTPSSSKEGGEKEV